MTGGIVAAVEPGSIAESLDVRPGDVLLEIDGHPLRDVLDVQFYAADEELDLLIRRGDEEVLYQVERDYDAPLGLDFVSPTFDGLRRCDNRCEFCFVTQMPPGLRRSLYVRDDDYRYSVLYGSFVTLTNLTTDDWERLAEQRLSPLYISVHATDPALRRRLLGRDDIPDILPQLDRLAALGIIVHAQIVLVPGINDGLYLIRTMADLADRFPTVQSIGVVPVGLTRYHRGRCRGYTPDEARVVVDRVAPLQVGYRAQFGLSVVYLADEWYLLAGVDVPANEVYDGYPQIENGIGLVRQFLEDSRELRKGCGLCPEAPPEGPKVASCTLACGTLIAPVMRRAAQELAALSGAQVEVVPVVNRLFGERVTVSGLLCGEDVIAALQGRDLGELVVLPEAMFAERPPEQAKGRMWDKACERTLDGLTVQDLIERLGRPVVTANWMSKVWDGLRGTWPV